MYPKEVAIKLLPGNDGEPGRRTRFSLDCTHETEWTSAEPRIDSLRELLCTVSGCAVLFSYYTAAFGIDDTVRCTAFRALPVWST